MWLSSSEQTLKRIVISSIALPFCLLATVVHAQDDSQWGSGKNLYEKVCRHCHDPEVGVGTLLAGRTLPAAYVQAIVRNGLNAMPAFPASYIDDESIAQVAEYLSTLPAPPAQP